MAGGLGGTYAGSPIACAAALATIETYEQDGLIERAREIGAVLIGRLNALRTTDARIGDVRGRGAMVAIELVDPETGAPDAALTNAVAKYAHANGVVCSPAAPTATSSDSSPRSPSATSSSSRASASSQKDSRPHDRPARGDDDVDRNNACRCRGRDIR